MILQSIILVAGIVAANVGLVAATTSNEYDYVIVGSGPGGGQLA